MNMLEKMFSLKGKVILITGGARGIGREVANHVAAVGADIVIFDKQGDKAAVAAKELREKYNCRAISYEVDVTDYQSLSESFHNAVKEIGQLDLLFNNAGIVIQKPVIEATPDEWLKVIDVNLNGVYYTAQIFGKYLIENNIRGSIVNTASMSGIIVNYPQLQASYNASKAAVAQLTKSLAVEWAEYGIRVNSISPGYIFTELTSFVREDWREKWAELTPMKRLGKPEELPGAVIYLLSESASFVTGSDLVIDGGFTSV
ncbi:glucose 1-dehydrogenase [Cytobacillus purgationiresistens]|uniref:NAD(P)-dependent dehydrogenase (Short-subunit alcohol dehydrogenase family) n=1 Tax=Cytobacillus purgationiresistens TaxID=863449 RepID=A0ABU0AJS6_9BACI|nr:glucose 1-dehydrogenase [Cytobacillus purgationiresistens]MDQ0271012.1 NAD(P)-dependent dehydrogenase (short-subunit alcohol dehydrogenase family) [Cytobacillus purgationiresistens]